MVPALAALLTAVSAGAQNAQLDGLLVTASQFTPVDMMKYSQNNYSFTTGRVAAMGGAFTALGGDMASMGINPAGLGMYRNSVWGLSPAMTFTGNRNAYATAHDNNASRFSFNNIGTVLQLSQRSNGLVSFNLGLSYNKMEDFNYRGSVRLPAAAGGSLLNIFQLQLNGLYDFFNTVRGTVFRRKTSTATHSTTATSTSTNGELYWAISRAYSPVWAATTCTV